MDCQEELKLTKLALVASQRAAVALYKLVEAQTIVLKDNKALLSRETQDILDGIIAGTQKELDQATADAGPYIERMTAFGRLANYFAKGQTKQ
jgi:hypothetical protein